MVREESVFLDALAQPVDCRAAFLTKECEGDDVLRARVDALLAAHESADTVLEPPSFDALEGLSDEQIGARIGHYKLLQKLGEGGCGVVYLAEQEEPVRRRVALKVIKAGMDTREVIARFTAERQALALMDHAGIAKVFDAGATRSGRPYFVMELVRGIPITRYCDEQGLSVEARLHLFIQVCDAVQHAHLKGIIHRDIKPSNILVALNDTTPAPKVIDFGIAKATQEHLISDTLVTQLGEFIGTPIYMSPEQADTAAVDIDTRTDVYSLGALLYELLAGRPAFEPTLFTRADRDGMRRIIREVEPPRPSARVAALPEPERAAIAQARVTPPAKLLAHLSGDLDWIVMKAMEKSRARRYDTPNALAADLTRHLNHEPVLARPPSRWYRFGRVVRRNRAIFASAAVVAFTLALGAAISMWLAVRARSAERVADVERTRAVGERARADDLLVFMLDPLREQLARVGRIDVLESLGDKAMEYFASISPEDLDDVRLASHAKALTQIGELRMNQARYPDALEAYTAAYTRASALVEHSPGRADLLNLRAQAEYGIGFVHFRRAELAVANEWLSRYHDTANAMIALEPENLAWQREQAAALHSLAAVQVKLGKPELARASYRADVATLRKLLTQSPADVDLKGQLADATSWLGSLAESAGDYTEALRRFREQTTLYEELYSLDPKSSRWKLHVPDGMLFQAEILAITGQRDTARSLIEKARPLFEALVRQDPQHSRWHSGCLILYLKEGNLLKVAGNPAAALPQVERARREFEMLAKAEPTDQRFAMRLAFALRLEAELLHALGRPAAAECAQRAVEISRARAVSVADHGDLAKARLTAGQIAAAAGDAVTARRQWEAARDSLRPLQAESRDWRILDPAARVAALLGNHEEARTLIGQLTELGYVPLEPWPEIERTAFVGNIQPQRDNIP